MDSKDMSWKEFSSKGGKKFKEKYGTKAYSDMGKKGHLGKLKKYGKDYYKKLAKLSVLARKRMKQMELEIDIRNGDNT